MRKPLRASAIALLLALPLSPDAQQTKTVEARTMEGVLTVTQVDRAGKTVTVRGPTGDESRIFVTPRILDLEQIQPGARFRVHLMEEVAIGVRKEGEPAASAGASILLAPKGGTPGKAAAKTVSVTGVIDAVDAGSRRIALRGPQGSVQTLSVADDVRLYALKAGDAVIVTYTVAVATQLVSTPQPIMDPAPAQ